MLQHNLKCVQKELQDTKKMRYEQLIMIIAGIEEREVQYRVIYIRFWALFNGLIILHSLLGI